MMMKRKLLYLVALMFAGVSGLAQASERIDAAPVAARDVCPPLLTEAECKAHHRILTVLRDGAERNAYLAMHTQLLDERRALCHCTLANNSVGLLLK